MEQNYEDIRQRLSVLNQATLPKNRDLQIQARLQQEIANYRNQQKPTLVRKWRRPLTAASSAAAAVALVGSAFFAYATLHSTHHTPARTGDAGTHVTAPSTPSTNPKQDAQIQPAQRQVQLQPINYTQAQITEIQNNARQATVAAFVPTTVTAGDQLQMVKNGNTALTFDYKNFDLIENVTPFPVPEPIDSDRTLPITDSLKARVTTTIYQGKTYTYVSFQQQKTYFLFMIHPDVALTDQQVVAIVRSLQAVQ